MTNDRIEAVARAIYEADNAKIKHAPWEETMDGEIECYTNLAKAALSALPGELVKPMQCVGIANGCGSVVLGGPCDKCEPYEPLDDREASELCDPEGSGGGKLRRVGEPAALPGEPVAWMYDYLDDVGETKSKVTMLPPDQWPKISRPTGFEINAFNPRPLYLGTKQMTEWKPVRGFEGLYDVSSNGEIRSVKRGAVLSVKIAGRYQRAQLWRGNVRTQINVHRIVALAFLGDPPDGKPEVNHIDGNRMNNSASNLEWCSRKENVSHSMRLGLQKWEKKASPPAPSREALTKLLEAHDNDLIPVELTVNAILALCTGAAHD